MKKIINGRKYDTETAKYLTDYTRGCASDFQYFSEELYRKRTGEYFLAGYGGPMSKYAKNLGGNQIGYGEEIIPLTIEQAKAWAERYCDGNEYEEIFGEVEE